ncbi:membrane protein [Williamsia phyllosphaerae]|uniref:Membrane protein n=2 Tax=Williamsia phyllosphaerae TaxID=885042 RepID=A0ABQ1V7P0_9NOCA|nr:membrane protein [Williamsia phyllosphaerae]
MTSATGSDASGPEDIGPDAVGGRFTPPVNDPWKGLRGIMAGTLILEFIVVLLALPIVARVGGGLTWVSGVYLVVLALLMVLGAGVQGRPWALQFDLALQVLLIVGVVFHWSIAAVGIVFGLVWLYIAYIKRDVRLRIERGLLPGQEPIGDAGADPA